MNWRPDEVTDVTVSTDRVSAIVSFGETEILGVLRSHWLVQSKKGDNNGKWCNSRVFLLFGSMHFLPSSKCGMRSLFIKINIVHVIGS